MNHSCISSYTDYLCAYPFLNVAGPGDDDHDDDDDRVEEDTYDDSGDDHGMPLLDGDDCYD